MLPEDLLDILCVTLSQGDVIALQFFVGRPQLLKLRPQLGQFLASLFLTLLSSFHFLSVFSPHRLILAKGTRLYQGGEVQWLLKFGAATIRLLNLPFLPFHLLAQLLS